MGRSVGWLVDGLKRRNAHQSNTIYLNSIYECFISIKYFYMVLFSPNGHNSCSNTPPVMQITMFRLCACCRLPPFRYGKCNWKCIVFVFAFLFFLLSISHVCISFWLLWTAVVMSCMRLCMSFKCWAHSIRRSKDEIINYICYLNEIQKVSSQIKRTHSAHTHTNKTEHDISPNE